MRFSSRGLCLAALLILCGCSPPTFDATSKRSVDRSVNRMLGSISGMENKREFFKATLRVTAHQVKRSGLGGMMRPSNDAVLAAMKTMHGKTVQEIFALSDALPRDPVIERRIEMVVSRISDKKLRGTGFANPFGSSSSRPETKSAPLANNPKPPPKEDPQLKADLKNLGTAYIGYLDAQYKDKSKSDGEYAPQNWEDLERFAQAQMPQTLESIRRLRGQGVLVAWGIVWRDATIGSGNFILAHKPDAPQAGGLTLDLLCGVYWRDAAEVQRLLELRKTCWPPEPKEAPAQVVKPAEPTTPDVLASSQPTSEEPAVEFSAPGAPAEMAEAQSEQAGFLTDGTAADPAAPPQLRTWSSANGKFQVEAVMIGFRKGQVTLKDAGGKIMKVPLDRLSSDDRAYVIKAFVAGNTSASPNKAGRRDTPLIGGDGGAAFRSEGKTPVVGVRCAFGRWQGQFAIGKIEAVFDRNSRPGPRQGQILARPGYAVAGFNVDAGQYVNALQIIFMRQNADGSLDPADQYTSKWFGNHRRKKTRKLGGTGATVVGFQGRGTVVLDALGLVVLGN